MKKTIVFLIFIFLIITPSFAWLAGWNYRKSVTITGQAGAGTNYQVMLKVGESSGSAGDDFHIGSSSTDFPATKDDGGDLRFTDNDGDTLLDFWVESVSGAAPNRTATIWVEVADDLGSNVDIYCYYGKSGAANASSGTNTFLLFDDFSGDSLDGDLWTQRNGNALVFSDGLMGASANTTDPSHINATGGPTTDNNAIRAKFRATGGTNSDERLGLGCRSEDDADPVAYNFLIHDFSDGTATQFLHDGLEWYAPNYGSWSKLTWYTAEIFHDGTNVRARIDDGTWRTWVPSNAQAAGYLSLNIGSFDGVSEWDWALIRKANATEPSFNAAVSDGPTLDSIAWSDVDGSTDISATDTLTFAFSEVMDTSTVDNAGGVTDVDTVLAPSAGDYGAAGAASISWTNSTTLVVTLGGGITLASGATVNPTNAVKNSGGGIDITTAPGPTISDNAPPTVTFNPLDAATGVAVDSNITITFSEAVRNTDDSALTNDNVDSLITLKDTDASGSNIAFDATIDGDKKIITINPTSDLSSEQTVYAAIGATVEDVAGNAITASNATFTCADVAAPTVTFSPLDGADDVAVDANVTITFNEAVRNTDDSALTNSNVDALITLKDTDASGTDIDFNATIDAEKKIITIDSTTDFSYGQTVYAGIGATVEDDADNTITASSVTFDVGTTTSTTTTTTSTTVLPTTSTTTTTTTTTLRSASPPSVTKPGGIAMLSGDIIGSAAKITVTATSSDDVETSSFSVVREMAVEPSSFRMYIDDGLVTDGASIYYDIYIESAGVSTFEYTPKTPLGVGTHEIRISFLDNTGLTFEAEYTGLKVLATVSMVGEPLCYPNPYNPNTGNLRIAYTLATDTNITVYVFNSSGGLEWKVGCLSGGLGGSAGYNEITWDGNSLANLPLLNNVYLIRIVDNNTGAVLGKTKVLINR